MVRRIAQVTMALIKTMMVEASTRYDPHAKWGINKRTSIKKANRQMRKSITRRMNKARRYLAECPGE
jgi:hypothetical protein